VKPRSFIDGLVEGMERMQPSAERTAAKRHTTSLLLDFLEQEVPTDAPSGRYSLEGHEPLRGIVKLLEQIVIGRESESRVDICKGEQLTVTTTALGFALWAVADQGYNLGYFMPSDKEASEIGMARLNPITAHSEYLSGLLADADVERGVLKQFGRKFFYMVGLNKIPATRPMDIQVSDEVDLTSEAMRKWKRGRMRHSKLRVEVDFSAPYRQDSGIAKRYDEGSQRKWVVKCAACGRDDIVLEEAFPECMRQFSGTWVRVCPGCHKKLAIADPKLARWVAMKPEREKDRHYSFRLSALAVEAIDANGIMKSYRDAEDDPEAMAIFDRTVRAIPNAGSLQPITDVELRRMERDYVLVCERPTNPVFMGADVGNACWIWFEEWLPEGRPRLVWAEKIHSDQWVERSIHLIEKFRPRFGVIDKMPLFSDSRKIAYAYPRTIALQQFENGKDPNLVEERIVVENTVGAARADEGPKYFCVKGDRNIILGAFVSEALHPDHGLLLPKERGATMDAVRAHLKKLQKEVATDARGNETHRFLEHVDNHFGMAAASARLARLFATSVGPFVTRPLPRLSRREQLQSMGGGDRDEAGRFGDELRAISRRGRGSAIRRAV
jgi:hypothetical protein